LSLTLDHPRVDEPAQLELRGRRAKTPSNFHDFLMPPPRWSVIITSTA
jgi:hypothetical protein